MKQEPKTEYKIISYRDVEILEEEVQEHLDNGWTLHGELHHAAKPVGDGTTIHEFIQALVRVTE